jgi:hypothetical protein
VHRQHIKVFMKAGDVIDIQATGIGVLLNSIVAAARDG